MSLEPVSRFPCVSARSRDGRKSRRHVCAVDGGLLPHRAVVGVKRAPAGARRGRVLRGRHFAVGVFASATPPPKCSPRPSPHTHTLGWPRVRSEAVCAAGGPGLERAPSRGPGSWRLPRMCGTTFYDGFLAPGSKPPVGRAGRQPSEKPRRLGGEAVSSPRVCTRGGSPSGLTPPDGEALQGSRPFKSRA